MALSSGAPAAGLREEDVASHAGDTVDVYVSHVKIDGSVEGSKVEVFIPEEATADDQSEAISKAASESAGNNDSVARRPNYSEVFTQPTQYSIAQATSSRS